jgi:hypothetical protein
MCHSVPDSLDKREEKGGIFVKQKLASYSAFFCPRSPALILMKIVKNDEGLRNNF